MRRVILTLALVAALLTTQGAAVAQPADTTVDRVTADGWTEPIFADDDHGSGGVGLPTCPLCGGIDDRYR